MNNRLLQVRELSRWGFDLYPYRPDFSVEESGTGATCEHLRRAPLRQSNVVLPIETAELKDKFARQSSRSDLLEEMNGLTWSLGVVDLRALVAFQRRICFAAGSSGVNIRGTHDWDTLFSLCFGTRRPVECTLSHDETAQELVLRTTDPNVHIRLTRDPLSPLTTHAGGPFFEVACYRNRWFLRDGYHRAYSLMQRGIFEVPAVIVHATTLEELGADRPWFFPEDVLFSDAPPLVIDFLNDELVLTYNRSALHKTIRVTIEEFLTPATD